MPDSAFYDPSSCHQSTVGCDDTLLYSALYAVWFSVAEVKAKNKESLLVNMGEPTSSQLSKINNYRAAGSESLTANDVFTVTFMASDSLVHRDLESWSLEVLAHIYRRAPGSAVILDHRYIASNQKGRIYDSRMTVNSSPSFKSLDEATFGRLNRKIVRQNGGLHQVWLDAYFPRNSETEDMLLKFRTGTLGAASTGGLFKNGVERCDNCICGNQRGIWGKECPKYHPRMPWSWFYSGEELDNIRKNLSPYTVWFADDYDSIELSLTSAPALAGARIPRHNEVAATFAPLTPLSTITEGASNDS